MQLVFLKRIFYSSRLGQYIDRLILISPIILAHYEKTIVTLAYCTSFSTFNSTGPQELKISISGHMVSLMVDFRFKSIIFILIRTSYSQSTYALMPLWNI